MSKEQEDDDRRFDAIMRQLLNTPPKQRSDMKLGKRKPSQADDEIASEEKRAPSA
jgi:hypothetical protein